MRRGKKRRTQQGRGGINPILVDFKKGVQVTKDMIKAVKKPINVDRAKRTVAGYRRQYDTYKRRGGTKSYNSWLIDKGYAAKHSGCSVM